MFTQFNHENSLSYDIIYAVYEDDYQNLCYDLAFS